MYSFKNLFILIIILGLSINLKADSFAYNDSLKIKTESENYILIHFHDWTENSQKKRFEMITNHQNPFLQDNNYSYVELIDKRTSKTIFKKPTPALTHIEIADDESFIIGVSNIMIWNPYQLIIFDIKGNLIKKRNFSSEEAKLSISEFKEFTELFPEQSRSLDSIGKIYHVGEKVYIDFLNMGMPDKLGEAWKHLFPYMAKNHLSDNFSETVTNWVFWFDTDNPGIRFVKNEDGLEAISIRDPKGQKIKIFIDE